jgi:hypothetical protein
MRYLKDLPENTLFTVSGAPHKGTWRKLRHGWEDDRPIVESVSRPKMLMAVDPHLMITPLEVFHE